MLPAFLSLALVAAVPSPSRAEAPAAVPAPVAARPPLPAGVAGAALLLAGLGAAAFLLSRRRARADRLLTVVESTSIGPRRHLVVARLADDLLVLGSSEAGISLLSTVPAPARAAASSPAPAPAGGPGLLARLRPSSRRAPGFHTLLAESVEDLELRRKLAAGQAGSVR